MRPSDLLALDVTAAWLLVAALAGAAVARPSGARDALLSLAAAVAGIRMVALIGLAVRGWPVHPGRLPVELGLTVALCGAVLARERAARAGAGRRAEAAAAARGSLRRADERRALGPAPDPIWIASSDAGEHDAPAREAGARGAAGCATLATCSGGRPPRAEAARRDAACCRGER